MLWSDPRAAIPNGSFETPGQSGLPANWQTAWSSSGSSEAWQYTYAGDAPDGSSVLRLHVRPGGGSTFVLSDPILVAPAAAYMITARMRYYLNSNSDTVFFSVIQLDAAGNMVGFDEVTGIRGDNAWDWVPKEMLIRSSLAAASIRIRIGLATSTESYLDVDVVQ